MNCDELYISYFFPPSIEASGITVFKRIVEKNCKVDVLQGEFNNSNDLDNYIDSYINNRFKVQITEKYDWASFIFQFIDEGLKLIDDSYEKIYSRSWLMANHFLASEYKFTNPDVFWTAEFSDPLIYDLNNNPKSYKQMIIDNEDYINRVNEQIKKLEGEFPLIENNSSAYFIAEYLVYLFCDKIIFTNKNQQEVMLNQFPVNVKEYVLAKSEIKPHPTLTNEFYHLKDIDLDLDNDYINIAYFGNDYYSKRHFESLFYAVESLNHKHKEKIRVYLYISNEKFIKKLIPSDKFIVSKPLEYLDFLNATTKFDVLIVNDVATRNNFDVNPYLPSKLSDYLGSNTDIWALYEKGSSLSKIDLKYKSDMANYDDCLNQLVKILEDKGFGDENYKVNDDYIDNRLTSLNELYEKEYNQNNKYKKQLKNLKKENKQLKSSSGFKIKNPLKKLMK